MFPVNVVTFPYFSLGFPVSYSIIYRAICSSRVDADINPGTIVIKNYFVNKQSLHDLHDDSVKWSMTQYFPIKEDLEVLNSTLCASKLKFAKIYGLFFSSRVWLSV